MHIVLLAFASQMQVVLEATYGNLMPFPLSFSFFVFLLTFGLLTGGLLHHFILCKDAVGWFLVKSAVQTSLNETEFMIYCIRIS